MIRLCGHRPQKLLQLSVGGPQDGVLGGAAHRVHDAFQVGGQ